VSGGRLLLGLGAGGGVDTPYAAEQEALGRTVAGATVRRRAVEAAVGTLRAVWSGEVRGVGGFLRPEPSPPVIIGGFGPKVAELAGRLGDGVNLPGGRRLGALVAIAKEAHAAVGGDPDRFVITASAGTGTDLAELADAGVQRAVVFLRPPFAASVLRAAAVVRR
jgi:alkanesulfonate monooxygenase SsuD/methylene tetrahydromethanopterin reductase-like flavin-dependent oxidoreductase (luciferase family)